MNRTDPENMGLDNLSQLDTVTYPFILKVSVSSLATVTSEFYQDIGLTELTPSLLLEVQILKKFLFSFVNYEINVHYTTYKLYVL